MSFNIKIVNSLTESMFLKKVFFYNKWMFWGMVVFITMQLFCFYKQGMVFSPWYNYGMYSGKSYPKTQYEVYNVSYKYGPTTRFFFPYRDDKIFLALSMFQNQQNNNLFFNNSVARISNKVSLHPSPSHYTSHISEANFLNWFNNYANSWIYPSKNSIANYTGVAIWNGIELKLADGLQQRGK